MNFQNNKGVTNIYQNNHKLSISSCLYNVFTQMRYCYRFIYDIQEYQNYCKLNMFNVELFDICLAVYPWYFLLVIEYEMMITFLLHTNHVSKYNNHVSWQNMYVKYFVYWCQISLCLVFFFSRISLKGPNQARTFVSCYLTLDDVCLLTI